MHVCVSFICRVLRSTEGFPLVCSCDHKSRRSHWALVSTRIQPLSFPDKFVRFPWALADIRGSTVIVLLSLHLIYWGAAGAKMRFLRQSHRFLSLLFVFGSACWDSPRSVTWPDETSFAHGGTSCQTEIPSMKCFSQTAPGETHSNGGVVQIYPSVSRFQALVVSGPLGNHQLYCCYLIHDGRHFLLVIAMGGGRGITTTPCSPPVDDPLPFPGETSPQPGKCRCLSVSSGR